MAIDWAKLAPHEPVGRGADDERYVVRPARHALGTLLRAGAPLIGIVGAVGVGKSTELMHGGADLASSAVLSSIATDHEESMQRAITTISAGRLAAVVVKLATIAALGSASREKLKLSSHLQDLTARLVSAEPNIDPGVALDEISTDDGDRLRIVLRDMVRAVPDRRPTFLIDGLERVASEEARAVIRELARFSDLARFVIVIPTELVVGPASEEITRGFKLLPVNPVVVGGPEGRLGRAFMRQIVSARLQPDVLPDDDDAVLDRAAEASGGIPRVFLQLVMDAAFYARLGGREIPSIDDLRDAMAEQTSSLRRLLIKGDVEELRTADGTGGLEVDPDRRLRFLAHGLLLEYPTPDGIVVHPAPLLTPILERGRA